MRYEGKVEWMAVLGLLIGIVVPAVNGIRLSSPWVLALSAAAPLLFFGLLYPQRYETAAECLVVQTGMITRRVPFKEITAVRHASDGQRGLTLSQDVILVEYGSKRLRIAPKDEETFLSDIAARAPQLSKQGFDLTIPFAAHS
jgi:hypothetical protein